MTRIIKAARRLAGAGGYGPNRQECRLMLVGVLVLGLLSAGTPVRAQNQPTRRDDDDKLGERLIRESSEGSEDVMQTIVRLMGESARQLDIQFDAGAETQTIQRDILDKLDEAIKVAASQRRQSRAAPSKQRSDKRRMPEQQAKGSRSEPQPTNDKGGAGPSGTIDSKGRPEPAGQVEGTFKETRRAWGHLPERERDELIQGRDEAFLEEYRTWIELYFKALQESE